MLQDTAWMVILQGLNYLVPLFVWPYLMVVLGAEGFGKIGFSLQLLQFMMLMVDFGFNLSATKQIATAPNQEAIDRIATDTLWAKIVLFALCTMITIGLLLLPRYAPYRWVAVVMFPMLIGNVFSFQWLFQGLGKIRPMSMVTCVCRLLLLPLTFWMVKTADDVLLAAAILASTYVLSGLILTGWAIGGRLFRMVGTNMARIREALKSSLPLFISTATSSIYAVLFVVILGYFASPYEVGCYSAVEKIMRVGCYLMLLPAIQVFYPKISKLYSEDRVAAQKMVRWVLVTIMGMMVVWGLVLFMGGSTIVRLLGKDYTGTETLFHIMAFIPLMIAMSGICGQLGLVAMGDSKQYSQFRNVYLTGAIVALVMVGALSVILNAQWAAICLLCAETIVGLGMYICYKRI